jgi:hypothetical protein
VSAKIVDNPFFVLGISPDASRIEIEREAQKLLGMLELDFAAVKTYTTPLGDRPRTPEAVRAAVAALRDPYQRLVAELWARHAPTETRVSDADDDAGWVPALRGSLGWRP